MFDEPEDDQPKQRAGNPEDRAKEKTDELRMHAELAAVFEGVRKFDASVYPDLSADLAREIQRIVGKLEKNRMPDTPVVAAESMPDAAKLLDLWREKGLSTNNYHLYRRPGEVMMVRWLEGEQVEMFYSRLQAHFDAAMEGHKEDERQATAWKKDSKSQAYLDALEKVEIKLADRYLRDFLKEHRLVVLSTQSADEMNIQHLTDYLMSVSAEEVVGEKSSPPPDATDTEKAWFFKLFSLRGIKKNVEQMCFFIYLQKSDDSSW